MSRDTLREVLLVTAYIAATGGLLLLGVIGMGRLP